jgi:hypothetical protein
MTVPQLSHMRKNKTTLSFILQYLLLCLWNVHQLIYKVISSCKFYALGIIKQTLTRYTHVTLHVTPASHNYL